MTEVIDVTDDEYLGIDLWEIEDGRIAKVFLVGDVYCGFIEAEYHIGRLEITDPSGLSPTAYQQIKMIADEFDALLRLRNTTDGFLSEDARGKYISGELVSPEMYAIDWNDINKVRRARYFEVPPEVQQFIADMADGPTEPADGYVYILRSDSGYWKIGRTTSPQNRIKTFGVKLPFRVDYELVIPSPDHKALEAELHQRFDYCRLDGEWFDLTDGDLDDLRREFENVAEQLNE